MDLLDELRDYLHAGRGHVTPITKRKGVSPSEPVFEMEIYQLWAGLGTGVAAVVAAAAKGLSQGTKHGNEVFCLDQH